MISTSEAMPRSMDWTHGKPCTQCGKPTSMRRHDFEGGGESWSYFAPLYHNVEHRAGFCGVECSFEWAKLNIYNNPGNR